MDDAAFENSTSAFLTWLLEIGVKMNPKMALADFRVEGRGRGLVAAEDIEQDEVIFSIPRESVLNMKNVHIEKLSVPETTSGLMPPWLSLTIFMMIESLALGSRWAPYFAVLPSKLDTLIFWDDVELDSLQGSAVLNKIGKQSAEALFHEYVQTLSVDGLTMELFHKTASTIMAYSFDVPEEEIAEESDNENGDDLVPDDDHLTIPSMIPLADMLNADADLNNARLSCDKEDLEMRAIKPIKKGEEIFNDYGPLPRSDLLRRYGYITDRYAVYDVVELSTNDISANFRDGPQLNLLLHHLPQPISALSLKDLHARLDLAKREDIFEDSYDISHMSSEGPCIPDDLIALVWLLLIDSDTLSAVENSEASIPSRNKMCTEILGNVFVHLLKERERQYAWTVEEDLDFFSTHVFPDTSCRPRQIAARKVQLGEKEVLREAMKEASSFRRNNERMRICKGKREADNEISNVTKRSRSS